MSVGEYSELAHSLTDRIHSLPSVFHRYVHIGASRGEKEREPVVLRRTVGVDELAARIPSTHLE